MTSVLEQHGWKAGRKLITTTWKNLKTLVVPFKMMDKITLHKIQHNCRLNKQRQHDIKSTAACTHVLELSSGCDVKRATCRHDLVMRMATRAPEVKIKSCPDYSTCSDALRTPPLTRRCLC